VCEREREREKRETHPFKEPLSAHKRRRRTHTQRHLAGKVILSRQHGAQISDELYVIRLHSKRLLQQLNAAFLKKKKGTSRKNPFSSTSSTIDVWQGGLGFFFKRDITLRR
jgi:hypothetical protein